jgi:hypothetical protein
MRHLTRRELLNAYEAMPREQKEAVKAAEQSTIDKCILAVLTTYHCKMQPLWTRLRTGDG